MACNCLSTTIVSVGFYGIILVRFLQHMKKKFAIKTYRYSTGLCTFLTRDPMLLPLPQGTKLPQSDSPFLEKGRCREASHNSKAFYSLRTL